MSQDPYASYDAAYVLGALSAQDRQDFERHMQDCPACARAVRELAGLPGLLTRVNPPDIAEVPDAESPPPSVLARVVHRVARRRRIRRATRAGTLLLAAALIVVAVLVPDWSPEGPAGSDVELISMADVDAGPTPVRAAAGLVDMRWGTRVDVRCSYPAPDEFRGWSYVLVLRERDGDTRRIASWKGVAGKTFRITAATALRESDIVALELRTASGRTLLRLRI